MASRAPPADAHDPHAAPSADLSTPARATGKYPGPSSGTVDQEPAAGPRITFHHRAKFLWKTTLLLVTFLALIPILLYQNELGAKVYLWFLGIVHLVGLAVFSIGVGREDIAPSRRGFYGRIAGLVVIIGLIYLASKGLQSDFGSLVFWGSLFAVWATHTAGLLLLHLRGQSEKNCPFV